MPISIRGNTGQISGRTAQTAPKLKRQGQKNSLLERKSIELFSNGHDRYAGIRHAAALTGSHGHDRVQVHFLYLGNIFYHG